MSTKAIVSVDELTTEGGHRGAGSMILHLLRLSDKEAEGFRCMMNTSNLRIGEPDRAIGGYEVKIKILFQPRVPSSWMKPGYSPPSWDCE